MLKSKLSTTGCLPAYTQNADDITQWRGGRDRLQIVRYENATSVARIILRLQLEVLRR